MFIIMFIMAEKTVDLKHTIHLKTTNLKGRPFNIICIYNMPEECVYD